MEGKKMTWEDLRSRLKQLSGEKKERLENELTRRGEERARAEGEANVVYRITDLDVAESLAKVLAETWLSTSRP